jgi:murein DD-endopeptidase MepM/ murein hydrolase activator NlpD
VREDRLAAAEREVAAKREAAAAHLIVVKDLNRQARQAKATVHRVVAERRDARQAAQRARAHDRAQLARLRKQEAHIRAMIAAAAAKSHSHYSGHTGGFLMRPVPGYVTSPFGYRIHPIYHYYGLHDGDDFHAPCGTPLKAAGTGTVIQTYYSSVWGKRLFLYLGQVNGSSVTVVYNHLNTWAVRRGSHVSRGQTIGYAGTTGWSTACHLHFTVLVNGSAVNPMNWF